MSTLGTRSGSQILRTFLPQQTADLRRGIWRVVEWTSAVPLQVDVDSVRRRLLREVAGLERAGLDNGFAAAIRAHAPLEVVELDERRGVTVERYPNVWVCDNCRRIGQSHERPCRCGRQRWTQLHFLGFHSCGAVTEPYIRRCPNHDDVRMHNPRSTKVADLRFTCPICSQDLGRGLGFNRACQGCGQGTVTWNVHKARSVYAPRGTVLVNPPRPERLRELLDLGGGPRALAWIVDGMRAKTPADMPTKQTRAVFIAGLLRNNIDPDLAEQMAELAEAKGQLAGDDDVYAVPGLDQEQRTEAEAEALEIAAAMTEGRASTADLIGAPVDDELRQRYEAAYPEALQAAGLAGIDLVERFPVLNVMYGYTRGGDPATSRLVAFRNRRGDGYRLHGDLSETEALFVRLDPESICSWLEAQGLRIPAWGTDDGPAAARAALLQQMRLPSLDDDPSVVTVGSAVYELIHTFAHRFIRQSAVFAGIDRDALSEYLVPLHLGFFVYAAARGDFVLGGLQAVFETDLHLLLQTFRTAESRCALDPGCSRGGGACSACLHLGEPSCRGFNTRLRRGALFGPSGYLS
jgi:hypothetical protein